MKKEPKYRAVNLTPNENATWILVGKFEDGHALATEKDQNGIIAFCDQKFWATKIVESLNKMEDNMNS